jgi:hypothetical protein
VDHMLSIHLTAVGIQQQVRELQKFSFAD